MTSTITPIVMPKWGLSMQEGTVVSWLVDEGAEIAVGTPILEVETDKIANQVEAADAGLLRRRVAAEGQTLPVKALLGVLAPPDVGDAEIDAYVASYVVPATAADEDEAASAYVFASVDGIRVRVARRGPERGVPVLLLHGFGGDLDNWLFNIDALAAAQPVIALDLPGHGQSDARLPGTDVAALAGFVVQLLDQLDVERVHVVGHSMGGAIGAQIARDAPRRVASLALICPAGLGDTIAGDYIDGFVAATSRRELKSVLELLFADASLVSRQMVDDVLKYKRLDGVDALLQQLAAAWFPGGRQPQQPARELAAFEAPLLVLWGAEDRVIPAAQSVNAPIGASVHVLPGAGHMVMMEKAAEVNALLKVHLGA